MSILEENDLVRVVIGIGGFEIALVSVLGW